MEPIVGMMNDKVRDAEAMKLIGLVEKALKIHNLEMGSNDIKELPLNDEITLDTHTQERNLIVYAVSKFSVIDISGNRYKFLMLDRDDIYTLQYIIKDEYNID